MTRRKRKKENRSKQWLPAVFVDPRILVHAYGHKIPRIGETRRDTHGKPIGVSVYDEISNLVREFPHLRDVFHRYRRNGEKRIKDLQISGAEKERLLYQILSMKEAKQARKERMSDATLKR